MREWFVSLSVICYEFVICFLVPYFEVIALTSDEYLTVISHLVTEQIIGAATYDALHVYAGIKANVDYFLSFNARDFRRVYPAVAHKIVIP